MTERETFLRCCEMLTGTGVREVARLLNDARQLHKAAMEYSDDTELKTPRKGTPKAGQAS